MCVLSCMCRCVVLYFFFIVALVLPYRFFVLCRRTCGLPSLPSSPGRQTGRTRETKLEGKQWGWSVPARAERSNASLIDRPTDRRTYLQILTGVFVFQFNYLLQPRNIKSRTAFEISPALQTRRIAAFPKSHVAILHGLAPSATAVGDRVFRTDGASMKNDLLVLPGTAVPVMSFPSPDFCSCSWFLGLQCIPGT